jgi:Ser/Thr protein kinase RdoA (MazF antagonist)
VQSEPSDHFHAPRPSAQPEQPGRVVAREKFSAREIAQVLSHYDIGVIQEIREYRRGSRRAAKLKLVAERGEFLLKRRAVGRLFDSDRARAAASHKLQQFATRSGVPVAGLVALKSGGTLLEFGGRLYELYQWVPGARYARHAEQARAAGIALARMHGAFANVELLEELPLGGFSEPDPVRAMIEQARERARPRTAEADHEMLDGSVEQLLSHLLRIEAKLQARGLPLQRTAICHGDFHPGNTLWFGDTLGAVIDFDSARHESVAAEIANACLQFSVKHRTGENPLDWPVGLEPENLRAFVAGYAAAPAIDLREIAPLVPWLMMSAIIAEAASPIARDGDFAGIAPAPFLRATANLVDWIALRTRAVSALIEQELA